LQCLLQTSGNFVIAQARSASVGKGLASLFNDVVELSSSERAATEGQDDGQQQKAHETPWGSAGLILLQVETGD
jgi:hypothetical protein